MIRNTLAILSMLLISVPSIAQTVDVSATGPGIDSFQQADTDDDDDAEGTGRSWLGQGAWFVQGGVSRWTAQFGENFGLGYGADGGYIYGYKENLLIRVGAGYYRFNADSIAGGPNEASATLGVIPILAGVDYLLSTGGSLVPYIGGSAGVIFLQSDFVDPTLTQFRWADVLDGYFGASGRLGLTMRRPDSSFEFGAMASYNMVFDELEEWNMGNPGAHHYMQFTAGITYFLESF